MAWCSANTCIKSEQPTPPPECKTEAEKTAFAFGWFKALETAREQPAQQQKPAAYDSLELHVTHSIVAGALYDFMGWLTSRRTRICLSDRDNASPAVDAIADFSKMRGLMLNDAQVENWQKVLVSPPASKPWVGLTIGEIQDLIQFKEHSPFALAEDIEAKLKEKNA